MYILYDLGLIWSRGVFAKTLWIFGDFFLELPGSVLPHRSLGFLYSFGYEFCMEFIPSYAKARYEGET